MSSEMRYSLLLALYLLSILPQIFFADSPFIKIENAWVQAIPPVSDTTAA